MTSLDDLLARRPVDAENVQRHRDRMLADIERAEASARHARGAAGALSPHESAAVAAWLERKRAQQ